jgi:hypothetical protein
MRSSQELLIHKFEEKQMHVDNKFLIYKNLEHEYQEVKEKKG